MHSPSVPSTLRTSEGKITKSGSESVDVLLEVPLPSECLDEENEQQGRIRRNAVAAQDGEGIVGPPFDSDEIKKALRNLKPTKAPGLDGTQT